MLIERNPRRTKRTRPPGILLVLLLLVAATALVGLRGIQPTEHPRTFIRAVAPPNPWQTSPGTRPEPEARREEALEGTVRKGESIASLLGGYLSSHEIHALAGESRKTFPLKRVRAGQPYRILLHEGKLRGFEYEIDGEEKLVFRWGQPEGLRILREKIPYDVRAERVAWTVESSLFTAVEQAGEHPDLAMRLAEIFSWDVDFMLDLRPGDSFQAIVEKRFRDGEFSGYGRVLAAEFINQGKVSRAFLFEDDTGRPDYYDAGGKNLRKAFLKVPLRFTRVSSGFSRSRLHPVTGVRLPHPGVDYAAPTGTPVRAVGDGVVLVRAYDAAGGNYVKIRHSGVYETAYLHLSRFGRDISSGARVKQGQVIGYVGSTGLATGPHLDFRVKENGRHVDPRTLKSPPAASIPRGKRDTFRQVVEPLEARLESACAVAGAGRRGPGRPLADAAGAADYPEP